MSASAKTLRDILFPDRDATFAGMIRAHSEPETGPFADNLITNEDSFPRVVGDLAARFPRNAVYLGVGPDQNLSYIAAARPSLAFIIDYRERNRLLHLIHKALISLSPDRAGYLERLTSRSPSKRPSADADARAVCEAFERVELDRARLSATIDETHRLLTAWGVADESTRGPISTLLAKLSGPGLNARFLALTMYPTFASLIKTPDRAGRPAHFLATERAYRSLRELQTVDRVLPLVGDFSSASLFEKLSARLRRHALVVGAAYVSDVEFFLLRSGRFLSYVRNLRKLPLSNDALLIRTSTREIDHPDRLPGDSSTTTLGSFGEFLDRAEAGEFKEPDDLFRTRPRGEPAGTAGSFRKAPEP